VPTQLGAIPAATVDTAIAAGVSDSALWLDLAAQLAADLHGSLSIPLQARRVALSPCQLTRHVEEERASRVLDAAKAAVAATVPGSESYTLALRNLAHLRACDGTWLLAPALAHKRMTASHYRIRLRRFLRLTLPTCNYADGAGSSRPPRSASNVANPTHDMYGDFALPDFSSGLSASRSGSRCTRRSSTSSFAPPSRPASPPSPWRSALTWPLVCYV
jgi:hypothetical protein